MPVTRSRQAKAGPSSEVVENLSQEKSSPKTKLKSKKRVTSSLEDVEPDSGIHEDTRPEDIEAHLRNALDGVSTLRKQIKELEARNKQLQDQLELLNEAEDVSIQPKRGRRGGMSAHAMRLRIMKLSNEVTKLERAREKDKKAIRKLRKKEIDRDAAELRDEALNDVGDTTDRMRKLLRRFNNLVTSPSIGEDEECIVCLEKLGLDTALSLPCQHVFCKICLEGNARAQDTPKCPTCREPYEPDLDGVERVQHTATQQWDALLEVAQEWARIDVHGGEEEPEGTEEEEVPFINDENPDASSSALSDPDPSEDEEVNISPIRLRVSSRRLELPLSAVADETAVHEEDSTNRTPQRVLGASEMSYAQSPTSEKRKRLEELAASRRVKSRW